MIHNANDSQLLSNNHTEWQIFSTIIHDFQMFSNNLDGFSPQVYT